MKKVKNILVICLFSLLLNSCYTTNTYLRDLEPIYNKTYRGETRKEIIDSNGYPDRIVNIGNGNKILVYEQFRTVGVSHSIGGVDLGRVDDLRFYAEFYLDRYDKCYKVRSNHTERYQKREKVGFWNWLNSI